MKRFNILALAMLALFLFINPVFSFQWSGVTRGQLSSNSEGFGTDMVGLSGGYGKLTEKINEIGKPQGINGGAVLDIHYGVMKGRGFLSTETGSERTYEVSQTALKGATSITLSANADITYGQALVEGQLIVYLGSDGDYKTEAIKSINANVLTLEGPLEESIDTGHNVFNFWTNEAHPTVNGYRAIADFSSENIKSKSVVADSFSLEKYNASTVSVYSSDTFDNPGSSGVETLSVSCPTGGTDGVRGLFSVKKTGSHEIVFFINTLGNDVKIQWQIGSYSFSKTVKTSTPKRVTVDLFPYNSTEGGSVFISTVTNGAGFYIVKNAQVLETEPAKLNINAGKHVFLGDSWIEQTGIVERMMSKFPDSEFINAGVGGNKAADAVDRFATDVSPHGPDYVWLLVGTNDYYGGISPDLFSYYINRFKTLCYQIGAYPIILTSSVGSADFSAVRFNLSRRYIAETKYQDEYYQQGAVANFETGTWTPVIRDEAGNVGAAVTSYANFSKVGNVMNVWFSIVNIDTTGLNPTERLIVGGLPYAAASVTNGIYPGALSTGKITLTGTAVVTVGSGEDVLKFKDNYSPDGKVIHVSDLVSGGADLYGHISYRVQ